MDTISVTRSQPGNELPVQTTEAANRHARRIRKLNKRKKEIKREAIYKTRSLDALEHLEQITTSVLQPETGYNLTYLYGPPFPRELARFLTHRGISNHSGIRDDDMRAFVTLYKSWMDEDSAEATDSDSMLKLANLLADFHGAHSAGVVEENDIDHLARKVTSDETMVQLLCGEDRAEEMLREIYAHGLYFSSQWPKLVFQDDFRTREWKAHLPEYPLTPYLPNSELQKQRRLMAPSSRTDKLRRQAGICDVEELRLLLGEESLPMLPQAWAEREHPWRKEILLVELHEFAYCVGSERAYDTVKAAMEDGRKLTPREKARVLESLYVL